MARRKMMPKKAAPKAPMDATSVKTRIPKATPPMAPPVAPPIAPMKPAKTTPVATDRGNFAFKNHNAPKRA